jgi:PTH1 family peptidyl-tRNA hydrolase
MKIIVGLGNPGEKYQNTRHNVGWLALDFFIKNCEFKIEKLKNNFASNIYEALVNNQKIIFIKPQTFMNNSGQAVKAICEFYKLDVQTDLLVIHDDIDLPLGKLKTTASASSAGHNGVASIIEHLSTQNFHRLRIGVETRQAKTDLPTETFVLQNFTVDEMQKLQTEIFPQIKIEINKFLDLKNYKITKLQN